jgi:hypothetical protein
MDGKLCDSLSHFVVVWTENYAIVYHIFCGSTDRKLCDSYHIFVVVWTENYAIVYHIFTYMLHVICVFFELARKMNFGCSFPSSHVISLWRTDFVTETAVSAYVIEL